MKQKHKTLITVIVTIIISLIMVGIIFSTLFMIMKNGKEQYNFYKEWCPKLNATTVEPVEGYYYTARCYKLKENEIKYYYILKRDEGNYLWEDRV